MLHAAPVFLGMQVMCSDCHWVLPGDNSTVTLRFRMGQPRLRKAGTYFLPAERIRIRIGGLTPIPPQGYKDFCRAGGGSPFTGPGLRARLLRNQPRGWLHSRD